MYRRIVPSLGRVASRLQSGFTLVELLIVISIIGVLVALIMPAVNSARESGRRASCLNNVHQLAIACTTHDSVQGFLPTGGWGWGWVGDADRGFGSQQPGGWFYNILPYLDLNDLHDMGKGCSAAVKLTQHSLRVQTPTAITICPTRRRLQIFTWWPHYNQTNFTFPTAVARSDYATNGGDFFTEPSSFGGGNGPWASNCGNADCGPGSLPTNAQVAAAKQTVVNGKPTGVEYPLSTLSTASIPDGLSFTYLLGEKNIPPDMYLTGLSEGDNENQYIGHNADTVRWTDALPMQDRRGYDAASNAFGSAHSAGFNMGFCDGAARQMSYTIDPTIHQNLGNRMDGEPTQIQKLYAN